MSLGSRTRPRSRETLAVAIRDLLRQEAILLLVVWIAVEVPVVCQHGPMSLFDPGVHDQMQQMQMDPQLGSSGQSFLVGSQASGDAVHGSPTLPASRSEAVVSDTSSATVGCCALTRHEISANADTMTAMIVSLSGNAVLAASLAPPLEIASIAILFALGLLRPLFLSPLDPPPRPA